MPISFILTGRQNLPAEMQKASWDSWLQIGDMRIVRPDGQVAIVDRKKDMILTCRGNV